MVPFTNGVQLTQGSRATTRRQLTFTIVIRNGKIVWKHGPHIAEF